jgi:GNAT superfamily N-acetyltransferase
VQTPADAPGWLAAFTAAERPELWERTSADRILAGVWPEYNHHGTDSGRYFRALFPRYADLQALFLDRRTDGVVARIRTIPFRWNGSVEDLPAGIDAAGLRALDEPDAPTALSALAAEVDTAYQSTGLSRLLLLSMAALARRAGLRFLVAPVRPSWKDRYPLLPIERYAAWCRDDGLPFDPWMRVHARLGARAIRAEPHSMHINAPTSDWESWIDMALPFEGEYVFPGGLAPLTVAGGVGDYWEPNVWMLHPL